MLPRQKTDFVSGASGSEKRTGVEGLLNPLHKTPPGPHQAVVTEYKTYYAIYNNKVSDIEINNRRLLSLEIEAENHKSAESRISDVDVASEMTSITQNMILRNSRVAILAQSNFMPFRVLRLLG